MPFDPTEVAARGEKIYAEKYQKEFEAKHTGKFVAIEVETERAFVGSTSGEALTTREPQRLRNLSPHSGGRKRGVPDSLWCACR